MTNSNVSYVAAIIIGVVSGGLLVYALTTKDPAPKATIPVTMFEVGIEQQPTSIIGTTPPDTWKVGREVCYKHVVYVIFPAGNQSVGGSAMFDPKTSRVVTC